MSYGLRRHDGAAAVEFALLLPLLVMLAFGIVEFSTAYNRSQGMQAGVREGARVAASGDVEEAAIKARVSNTLQGNDGGSGWPAPGGTVDGDYDLTVEYFADQASLTSGTVMSSTPATRCEEAYAVRVTTAITTARQDAYRLTLPLIPGDHFLSREWEAIFRCLG